MAQRLMNPTSIHEDTGLIPGLAVTYGVDRQLQFRFRATELPYAAGMALKRQKKKTFIFQIQEEGHGCSLYTKSLEAYISLASK